MTHDVFISHSSKDKAIADAACARLEARGLRCWIAPRDVVPGATYPSEIRRGIADCRVFLAVYTAAFNESEETLAEVHRAVKDGKYVIPFRIEDVRMRVDMEHFLSTRHWLDAMTPPLEAHLDRLAGVIEHVLRGDDARPLPLPAPPRKGRPGAKLLVGAVLALMLITSALAWFLRPEPLAKDPRIGSRVGERLEALASIPDSFVLAQDTSRLAGAREEWKSISHADWNRASAAELTTRLLALEQEALWLERAERARPAPVPQAPAVPARLVAEFSGEPADRVFSRCDEILLRFRVRNTGAAAATGVTARVTSDLSAQIRSTTPSGRVEADAIIISLPDLPPGIASGEFSLSARPNRDGPALFRVSARSSDATCEDAVATVRIDSPRLTLTPTLGEATGASYTTEWTVANVGDTPVASCEVSCGGDRKRLQPLAPGERGTLSFVATPDPESRAIFATLSAPCVEPFTKSVSVPVTAPVEVPATRPAPNQPPHAEPPGPDAAKPEPVTPDPEAKPATPSGAAPPGDASAQPRPAVPDPNAAAPAAPTLDRWAGRTLPAVWWRVARNGDPDLRWYAWNCSRKGDGTFGISMLGADLLAHERDGAVVCGVPKFALGGDRSGPQLRFEEVPQPREISLGPWAGRARVFRASGPEGAWYIVEPPRGVIPVSTIVSSRDVGQMDTTVEGGLVAIDQFNRQPTIGVAAIARDRAWTLRGSICRPDRGTQPKEGGTLLVQVDGQTVLTQNLGKLNRLDFEAGIPQGAQRITLELKAANGRVPPLPWTNLWLEPK